MGEARCTGAGKGSLGMQGELKGGLIMQEQGGDTSDPQFTSCSPAVGETRSNLALLCPAHRTHESGWPMPTLLAHIHSHQMGVNYTVNHSITHQHPECAWLLQAAWG